MSVQPVSGYYDRHWRWRMEREPTKPNIRADDLGVIRLLLKHGSNLRSILDLGCGIGLTLQYLQAIPGVEELCGIEPSEVAAEEAKKRFPNIRIHVGFGEDMSVFPDASFDAVVAVAVFEHIYDTHRVLNEINRVLKPGGLTAIYTTDFNLLKKVLVSLFAFEKCFDVCGGHIRFFTKRSLCLAMSEHGFETVDYSWDASYWGMMPQGQNALFRKTKEVRILKETV